MAIQGYRQNTERYLQVVPGISKIKDGHGQQLGKVLRDEIKNCACAGQLGLGHRNPNPNPNPDQPH
jgi:hypothetical protein